MDECEVSEQAVANVAERYIASGEVAELIHELYGAAPEILALIGKVPFGKVPYEVSTLATRLRSIVKAVDGEQNCLIEQAAADAAEARDMARESLRDFDMERAA